MQVIWEPVAHADAHDGRHAVLVHGPGVRRHRPHWRRRYEAFPQPIATVSGVLVWAWPDAEAWARETGRLKDGTEPA
jgi:hypothetical protein